MKKVVVLVLWACASCAFGGDDPQTSQQRIDAARARLDAAARELAELHRQDTFQIEFPNPEGRVSLGVLLMPGGRSGVEIGGVTPGGPAADVGIRAGDVLVAINGASLGGGDAGPPLARVFDALKGVAPGDVVRLDYLRNGETLSADVTAGDPVPSPAVGVAVSNVAYVAGPGAPPAFVGRGMIGGLELFDLTEELGHYFGANDGVLVLAAPSDKGGLIAGDVVRSIDGKPVATSADCINALSRVSGEASVEILRDGTIQTVQVAALGNGPVMMPFPPGGGSVQLMRTPGSVTVDGHAAVITTAPIHATSATSATRPD